MKLIIFVQLFYRDYERSRDFRGGGGASQSAISLRNQRWLIGLLMIFGSFTSSVNNCHRKCLLWSASSPSVREFPYEDAFQEWTLRKQRVGLHVIEKCAV